MGDWSFRKGKTCRHEVMAESHGSRFMVHLGGDKMYQDMRRQYWWSGMKRDIAVFVSKCDTCQLVKGGPSETRQDFYNH